MSGCRVVSQCAVNVRLVLLDTETIGNGGISCGLGCNFKIQTEC